MEIVRLRNGSEANSGLVASVVLNINCLLDDEALYPMAFWELVLVCQDDSYEPMAARAAELKKSGLMLPDGSIHAAIRDIVLSSVEGEGADMKLVSPVVELKYE